MILAGDAGGTKTILALYSVENDILVEKKVEKFSSQDFNSLQELISTFLKDSDVQIEKACIGVPGPVIDGTCISTNLSWEMDEKIIREEVGFKKFKLVNDLVAFASIVPHLKDDDIITIYEGAGKRIKDTTVVLAPGTGLGVGFVVYTENDGYKVIPSEGGHAGFAPTEDIEIEMFKYMNAKYGRVSFERVASGLGLVNIFDFLKDSGYSIPSANVLENMENGDPGAVISAAALSKSDPLCEKALDLFTSALGAQAGNLVLTLTAQGGVYLGGGIPMKILDKLKDGTLVKSYLNKGRVSYVVETAPIYIIKDSQAGLKGAAYIAESL